MARVERSVSEGGETPSRRVPALLTYLAPFRVMTSSSRPAVSATIAEVNSSRWDYVGLHEVVGSVDVGLEPPSHMVVGVDGCLALPPLPEFSDDQTAIRFFNRCLAASLLGGTYCEAVSADGLDLGSIIDWKFIRSHQAGLAATNQFHVRIRHLQAAPMEAIALHNPRELSFDTFSNAVRVGFGILDRVSTLRGEFLLNGVTGIARRDWGAALSNLWIVIEQLLEELWIARVVEPSCRDDPRKSRRDQLQDSRTWTAAARAELLFQKGTVDRDTLIVLSGARKARNELSHVGLHPTMDDAYLAYQSVGRLLGICLPNQTVPLFNLDLSDHSLSDPFSPPDLKGIEPTHWMPIPKLPGEDELERSESATRRRKAD
jgi:hypothetical protein